MKTQILHSYIPRDGYFIVSVLLLTENKTAIFTSKFNEPSYLDILDSQKTVYSVDLSQISNFDTTYYYKCYFKFGQKFGIMHRAEELLLFDINNINEFEIVKIINPFKPDQHGRRTNAERVSNSLIDNKLLFGLGCFANYGSPPRYLTQLEIKQSKSLFGFGKSETHYNWGSLFELPKNNFPETAFGKFNDNSDWLNIRAVSQIDDKILVHSTGGTSTRLKSGDDFEFNIIAKFDKEFNWIKNFEINKGLGRFSTDKKYFIQHSADNKNKLYFYFTEDLTIDFEISLTAKQNLGSEKATQIQADKLGDKVYIYNYKFLNLCKLIN